MSEELFFLKQGFLNFRQKKVATAKNAMVSTQHPSVTMAMLEVLRDGGNAVDATITGSLLQGVLEPHQTSHVGSLDFMYYEASEKKIHYMNAAAEFPDGLSPFIPNPYSNRAGSIGGSAHGWREIYKKFGTKNWSYYVQPAIKAAELGQIMTSFEYGCLYEHRDINTYFSSGREFYYPNGFLVPVGQRWKKPKLAETLRCLAKEGQEYFITGDWAKHYVEIANDMGWNISLENIKAYKTRWVDPIKFTYKDNKIIGNPPPSPGGLLTAYILGVLENFDLRSMGHYTQSAETLFTIAWMFKRAIMEQSELNRDPFNYKIPENVFLSKDYQRFVAEIIRESKPKIDLTKDLQLKYNKANIGSYRLKYSKDNGDSCHNIVVDTEGNWVTCMHNSHGGGIPGLIVDGVKLEGMKNDAVCAGPGRRHRSAICPIMILNDCEEPWMALGTPSIDGLSMSIVLANILEFNMDPYSAIDAARFLALKQEVKKGLIYTLEIEDRISEDIIADLAKLGVNVKLLEPYRWNMGSFQIVWKDKKSGLLKGVSDPRRLGYAEGF
ncbi:gamma-glutamyltransferase [Thermoproteota archaeon]